MWTLLGDPAMRLPIQPLDIRLEIDGDSASPGRTIEVKGTLPDHLSGTNVHITLQRPIGSMPTDLEATNEPLADVRERVIMENHQRANNVIICSKDVASQGKDFRCKVGMPSKAPWPTVVIPHAVS